MRVAVFGGTGFLGRAVMTELARQGIPALAVARGHCPSSPVEELGFSLVRADLSSPPPDLAEKLAGVTHFINLIGTSRSTPRLTYHQAHVEAVKNLLSLAEALGIEHLVHLSVIGADPDHPAAYFATKGEGEGQVAASGLSHTILAPSLMFGEGSALMRQMAGLIYDLRWAVPALAGFPRRIPPPFFHRDAQRWLLIPELDGRFQPIFVEEVAEVAVKALTDPELRNRRIELVGDECFTLRQLQESLAELMGLMWKKPLILPEGVARFLRIFLPYSLLPYDREEAAILKEDLTSNFEETHRVLGRTTKTLGEVMRPILREWMMVGRPPELARQIG